MDFNPCHPLISLPASQRLHSLPRAISLLATQQLHSLPASNFIPVWQFFNHNTLVTASPPSLSLSYFNNLFHFIHKK
jgi:hypothetical protein